METIAVHPSASHFVMGGRLRGGDWNAALFDHQSGERIASLKTGYRVTEAVYLADRVVVMTRRPGLIKEIVDIKSIRERERWDQVERIEDVMDQPSFVGLRSHIWRLLRKQHAGDPQ